MVDCAGGSGASIESSDDDRSSTRSVSPEGAPSSSAGAAVRGLSGRWDEGGDDAGRSQQMPEVVTRHVCFKPEKVDESPSVLNSIVLSASVFG